MMFRRAGAMRCNHIVLLHRGTSKEINGGGKGEVFPLFLVSHAFDFGGALLDMKAEMHRELLKNLSMHL